MSSLEQQQITRYAKKWQSRALIPGRKEGMPQKLPVAVTMAQISEQRTSNVTIIKKLTELWEAMRNKGRLMSAGKVILGQRNDYKRELESTKGNEENQKW